LDRPRSRFVDFLAAAGQGLWQMLPLGPTGYRDSPYQCTSAFAGNPLLISPERLVEAGWIAEADLDPPEFRRSGRFRRRRALEARSAGTRGRASSRASEADQADYAHFCEHRASGSTITSSITRSRPITTCCPGPTGSPLAQRDPEALADWSERPSATSSSSSGSSSMCFSASGPSCATMPGRAASI
jgi:4-alpha-glucanotransferase